jgi:hypothetical protein
MVKELLFLSLLHNTVRSQGRGGVLKYASLLSVKNHMLLLLPVTRDDVISWRCFAFSTVEWSALSLGSFYMHVHE